MEHSTRTAEFLPCTVDSSEECESLPTKELWFRARTYSRLRHRTSPRRNSEKRRRYEALKLHYLRRATANEPDAFVTFADPGIPHLLVVYHRIERTLLHVPVAAWTEAT